jgi:hypothetical protein
LIYFPIDSRSSFPNPGPIENASLTLLELSFNGQDKDVRDLLINRLAYVDVCDSRGLTALHFATYNVHINVINILLDFGGNVNQLSDDGLTPLALASILYYGNNPQQTINTALEHIDPVIPNPRTSPLTETINITSSNLKDKIHSDITDETNLILSLESIKIYEVEKKSKKFIEIMLFIIPIE